MRVSLNKPQKAKHFKIGLQMTDGHTVLRGVQLSLGHTARFGVMFNVHAVFLECRL